ncbi:hypothetical protein AAJP84_00780 [Bartonella schoenbuchensis]|uniref:hypothetical protein n=1 Tax=Bartonella schoenbuchensis TaxID=165694 RepID=UPI0031CCB6D5
MSISKKYELTEESEKVDNSRFGKKYNCILHRIRALRDFSDIKAGDLGGFIETEDNLSHEGDCWVYDGSYVSGNAMVSGDEKIKDTVVCDDNVITYEMTFMTPQEYMASLSRLHRFWKRLFYYWQYRIWI